MKIALVPGSFDPVTYGHLDLARRAAALFDRVLMVVMDNRQKSYLFTAEERVALVREAASGIEGVEVDVWGGMLWEYVRDNGVCAIVKGLRSAEDCEYELLQARFNAEKWPAAQTVFLPSSEQFEQLSSTELKARCAQGLDIGALAPPAVCRALKEKYNR